jgi:hypothetical protein
MQQMVLYCKPYCLLNTFRAPLCPSSGAQEYYTGGCCLWYLVLWFTGCRSGVELWVMCPVFGMLLSVWCGAVGYVAGVRDAAASRKPDT